MKFLFSSILALHAAFFCTAKTAQLMYKENVLTPYDNHVDIFHTEKLICTDVSGANEGNNCVKISEDGNVKVLLTTWEGDSKLDIDTEYCLLGNKSCVTISADGKIHIIPITWEQTASGNTWCTGYNENSKEINCLTVDDNNTIKLLPHTWVFPLFL